MEFYKIPIQLEGVPDKFIPHGNTEELFKEIGLDVIGITEKLQLILNKVMA